MNGMNSPRVNRPSLLPMLPPLGPDAEQVLASLYETQPATRQQVAQRTGLAEPAVERGLRRLHDIGVLRASALPGGRPNVVWLDFVPFFAKVQSAGDTTAEVPA